MSVSSPLEAARVCSGVDWSFAGLSGLTDRPFRPAYYYCREDRCDGAVPCLRHGLIQIPQRANR